MPRSFLIVILALAAASVASCSTANAPKAVPPPFFARSTTLQVTGGIGGLTEAEEGTIADLAASPNGLTLATAMVAPGGNRVDVIIRDLIATGAGTVIASFNGPYDSISMHWVNNATIALALRRHPELLESGVNGDAPKSDPTEPAEEPPPSRADGLQLIVVTGAGSVAPLKFSCPMSALSWSAHGVYAVGQGDAGAAPVIIDRRNST